MKPSFYNVFVELNNNKKEYILYNTLTRSAFVVDEQVKNILENLDNFDINQLEKQVSETFKEAGIIIDDEIDELKIVKVEYDLNRFKSDYVKFVVIPTYECNLACPYCYVEREDIANKKMSNEKAEAAINFIKNITNQSKGNELSLTLFGGEPLANIDGSFFILDSLDQWCKEKNIKFIVRMYSNGTLLTKEIADELLKHNISFLQITLAGPKKIHDEKRVFKNGEGTFEKTIDAIKIAINSKIPLVIAVNIDKDNKDSMEELLEDLISRGLTGARIMFTPIYTMPHSCAEYEPHCLSFEEWGEVLPNLQKMALDKGFDVPLDPYLEPFFCWAVVKNSFVIDPFGDIYKCTSLLEKKHSIGTLENDGKIPKFKWPYYDLMSRDPTSIDACKACKYLPMCGGGCPALSYFLHGTFHKQRCVRVKPGFDKKIKVFFEESLTKN